MATPLREIEAEPRCQEEESETQTEQEDYSDNRTFVNVSSSIYILCRVIIIVIHV